MVNEATVRILTSQVNYLEVVVRTLEQRITNLEEK